MKHSVQLRWRPVVTQWNNMFSSGEGLSWRNETQCSVHVKACRDAMKHSVQLRWRPVVTQWNNMFSSGEDLSWRTEITCLVQVKACRDAMKQNVSVQKIYCGDAIKQSVLPTAKCVPCSKVDNCLRHEAIWRNIRVCSACVRVPVMCPAVDPRISVMPTASVHGMQVFRSKSSTSINLHYVGSWALS
jgi:hypothetical protein